jgi:hypothetical protein
MIRRLNAIAMTAVLLCSGAALAEDEDPRFTWMTDLQIRANPKGLESVNRIFHQHTYVRDGSLLFDGVYLRSGLEIDVSPADLSIGPVFEWMPIRLLILGVSYRVSYFFNTFDNILSFESGTSDFGAEVLDEREEAQSGFGEQIRFEAILQAKVGPIIIRNQARLFFNDFGRFDGPFVYEATWDTLQEADDSVFVNLAVVAYEIWQSGDYARGLAGGFHEYVAADEAGLVRQRAGVVFVAIPDDNWGDYFRPRLYVQAGVNLEDVNRDGEFFVQGGVGVDLHMD